MTIKDKNILDNLIRRIHDQKIDMFKGGFKNVELIIQKEFAQYFEII